LALVARDILDLFDGADFGRLAKASQSEESERAGRYQDHAGRYQRGLESVQIGRDRGGVRVLAERGGDCFDLPAGDVGA
jgi:hypothetical protein